MGNEELTIAPECFDVVAHPFQSGALVQKPEILRVQPWSIGEAEDVDSVVDRDHNVRLRALHPVVRQLVINLHASCLQSSARDEHNHRQPFRFSRRPDVERKTVFRDGSANEVFGHDLVPDGGDFGDVLWT